MMGYELANPLLLWGAALATLPIIIHLINRRRSRPHPFAAIDFVLRSRKRTARRLRLRRLLLFLARTMILLAVPLALSRPQAIQPAAAATPRGPAATAIVLDTSLSMSYRRDGHTLLERAKQQAREALADLAPEDSVTLVVCDPEAPPPAAPGFERARVREAIDAAAQTYLPQDLTSCLARAARALAESAIPAKRIVLASDLTAAAFRLDVPAPTIPSAAGEVKPEVVLLDAANGAPELPNRAITALRIEPAPAVGHRAFAFTLTVANHSSQPAKDLKALLKVGNDVVAKSFVDVPAHGTAVKTLSYRFPAGGAFSGSVEIAGDALTADDVRHFALKVPKDVRALVVDGAPHPVRFLDEAFFVEAALESPGSPVRPTLRDAETAVNERFADFDLVLLLNVRTLPAAKVDELDQLVKNGGGLFISMGDQVDPDLYNESLKALLPRKLHLPKTAADRKEEGAEQKAARLAQVAFDHPAFAVFTGEAREAMLSARTYRYFLLEPSGQVPVTTLASFDDGAPALLEARHGQGRVLLYTSTVDRDWTDWPIRPSFLPAMQRLSGWLAGALDERGTERVLVGETKKLELPNGAEAVRFKTPDGKELTPANGQDGKPAVGPVKLPGLYQASGKLNGTAGPMPELSFAVNVDPRESDLSRLDERELKAYFGEKTRTERSGSKDETSSRFPAWSALLAVAVALFFSEGLLARK